jgi:endonuclease III related protein
MSSFPCSSISLSLIEIFQQLLEHYGEQHWWPGITKDEVIIGAVLTQNTNWTNVAKAIQNLKRANACTLEKCASLAGSALEELIKPSGFFRIKAIRLQNVAKAVLSLQTQSLTLPEFRKALLSIHGVGPETADSILLYAFNLPVFVIDAYTKRIYSKMKRFDEHATYHEIQDCFQEQLPKESQLYNEYHALIVKHAKEICRKKPDCEHCIWGKS